MSRFKKTNVQLHRESYGGVHPAVNVKVHGYNTALVDDVML